MNTQLARRNTRRLGASIVHQQPVGSNKSAHWLQMTVAQARERPLQTSQGQHEAPRPLSFTSHSHPQFASCITNIIVLWHPQMFTYAPIFTIFCFPALVIVPLILPHL